MIRAAFLAILGLFGLAGPGTAMAATRQAAPSACEASLFLAGDAMLTLPWSEVRDPAFLRLIDEIRAADVAIVNLETVIHEFEGYAQADAGGTYMASPPEIASELAWAGVDMVAHANNHAFDYGSIGVLATNEHVAKAGLVLAGSGKDLQAARAPRYATYPGGKVALVAMASSFVSYGKASRSRPDLHGRPGLNPLATTSDTEITITRTVADGMGWLAQRLGYTGERFKHESFWVGGFLFRVGDGFAVATGPRIVPKDRERNLAAIRQAAAAADVVVVSIHAHSQGAWLREFAHEAIELGADVFFVHGPHKILGIEVYEGAPIFYGMGDFVFQAETVPRLPSDFYESVGLGDDATPKEAFAARSANGTRWVTSHREGYESFAAVLCLGDGKVSGVRLLPLDLHFEARFPLRGRPHYADEALGRSIFDQAVRASRRFGTAIDYDEAANQGRVRLD